MISLQTKILLIVLGALTLLGGVFFYYAGATSANYRQLRTREIAEVVHSECERINKIIAQLECTVTGLAGSGAAYFSLATSATVDAKFLDRLVLAQLANFSLAIGGGIWFEPYKLAPHEFFAAYADREHDNRLQIDPQLTTPEYNYPRQNWYQEIKIAVGARKQKIAWTPPYLDDVDVPDSLMISVGAGIFDVQKNFVGMATLDWRLDAVVAALTRIQPTPQSFAVLYSPENDYILSNTAVTPSYLVGEKLSALTWYEAIAATDYTLHDYARFTLNDQLYAAFTQRLDNGLCLTIVVPEMEIFQAIDAHNRQFLRFGASAALLIILATLLAVKLFINRPIKRLIAEVDALGRGDLHVHVNVETTDELGKLGRAFNAMTVRLRENTARHARLLSERERLHAEINIAAQIQRQQIPPMLLTPPNAPALDVYATLRTAREVGGDFYDGFMLDEKHWAVVVADVIGKGLDAALLMVVAKTLIRDASGGNPDPAAILTTVNQRLCENGIGEMLLTLFFGVWEINTEKFTYVNAGNPAPLLISAPPENPQQSTITPLPVHNVMLGGMRNAPYTTQKFTWRCGTTLLVYTDGILKTVNRDGKQFSETQLRECAPANLSAQATVAAIERAVDAFADGATLPDDFVLLGLRLQPNK